MSRPVFGQEIRVCNSGAVEAVPERSIACSSSSVRCLLRNPVSWSFVYHRVETSSSLGDGRGFSYIASDKQ